MQMKKACLTVRQQQMSQLQQKGELPLSMMDQVGREGLAATLPKPLPPPKRQSSDFSDLAVDKPNSAKRKPQQPSLDLFTREIQVSCPFLLSTVCRGHADMHRKYSLNCYAVLQPDIPNLLTRLSCLVSSL